MHTKQSANKKKSLKTNKFSKKKKNENIIPETKIIVVGICSTNAYYSYAQMLLFSCVYYKEQFFFYYNIELKAPPLK